MAVILDDDIKALYDSPDATICVKAQLLQLQANRDFQAKTLGIGSESQFARDYRHAIYQVCLEKACDLRRQQMSTSTSSAVEDDIIADIDRLADRLYGNALAKFSAL